MAVRSLEERIPPKPSSQNGLNGGDYSMTKRITLLLLLAAFSSCAKDSSQLTPSAVLIQSAACITSGDSTGYLMLKSKRNQLDFKSNPASVTAFFNEWKDTHVEVKIDSEIIRDDSATVYYHLHVTPKAGVDTFPPSAGPGCIRLIKEEGKWRMD
jgi:hypothetical protein